MPTNRISRFRFRAVPARRLLRARTARRVLAASLLLLAVALALRSPGAPAGDTSAVVVAAHDLAPGIALSASDIRVVQAPASLIPGSALRTTKSATGRTLAGAAGAGEPITEARLVGSRNTVLTARDPTAVVVPVRLADPSVADLVGSGSHVDVVALDPQGTVGTVLATDAVVVTVRHEDGKPGLVLLALPEDTATRVAATTLAREVTITLR
ncbi:SAF domain-containing protein [Labedaea rhizosphaerae]|uniref:Flp pilus assembly protein CpaB n=1 Tax=Labedaea rhizosphaerae TaxID=598644 RepID=A0A4V3D047_LABRH|nr:SAF domain-containing protein [Labedaea rhizosphaerae]TDQ04335.1 Flp pilus assembly protein CpaB [Labedaea rhizosphaerae]